jgi:diguanylate cyclase (GGDEF)-like protein
VLKRFAGIVTRCIREGDVRCRYGGEEFLAIFPQTNAASVREIGERIRVAVEQIVIPEGDRFVSVTVSLGATAYPEAAGGRPEDLIRIADEALYASKRGGRNQFTSPPEQTRLPHRLVLAAHRA